MTPAPSGAQCAIHFGIAASATCSRCGNFMCATCTVNGAETMCPTCRAAVGPSFPLDGSVTLGELFSFGWDRFKSQGAMVVVTFLVAGAILGAGGLIASLFSNIISRIMGIGADPLALLADIDSLLIQTGMGQLVGLLIGLPVQGVAMVGLHRVLLDVAAGRQADLQRMFAQLHLIGKFVVVQGAVTLATTVPMYLLLFGGMHFALEGQDLSGLIQQPEKFLGLILPAVFAFFAVTVVLSLVLLPLTLFAIPELVVTEGTPADVLLNAWKLGSGQRARLFGYGFVFALVMMVSFIACCLPIVVAVPFVMLLNTIVFMALRKSSDLPAAPKL